MEALFQLSYRPADGRRSSKRKGRPEQQLGVPFEAPAFNHPLEVIDPEALLWCDPIRSAYSGCPQRHRNRNPVVQAIDWAGDDGASASPTRAIPLIATSK
ncbi:MAG: hypothetical protein RLZZ558_1024 [Planctomycetota bacterium]